jgi:outer membrane lipoprotein LolB
LLGACSTPTRTAITSTKTQSGRIAVQVVNDASRSFNADFELTGSARSGQLLLSGILGTRLAEATWGPAQVILNTGSEQHIFQTLDQMAQEVFGESIPLAALFDWLEGHPWPQAPSRPLADKTPGFQQIGWVIDLQRFDEGRLLAQRASPPDSTQPELRLRIRLDRP